MHVLEFLCAVTLEWQQRSRYMWMLAAQTVTSGREFCYSSSSVSIISSCILSLLFSVLLFNIVSGMVFANGQESSEVKKTWTELPSVCRSKCMDYGGLLEHAVLSIFILKMMLFKL
ncbi:hypothetical protein EJB05_29734 [Eragrostis curvula]|uniref:Uncharacterized protein n=1 Tax=Eragrostis curvula TaxID=38414 RepID=A0A5J9UV14_9POAL|nr:hypothetical protein EJB05_29734 [Eragrostis curvula]